MTISIECPDLSMLRQLLDGTEVCDPSGTWGRDDLERHVNECELCQGSIERLVAGKESWEGTARQLAEIEAARVGSSSETPALRDLIDREKDRWPVTATLVTGTTSEPDLASVSLDFLQPSDQPESRGRMGSYEVLEVVGRGGMGLVLKAYDPSLRRIVAIKVMAGHLASSPVARKRFVREARAAAAVSHDHVVAIYSVEENQEPPFLVMQFVSGKTLQERIVASGPLSVPEILRIGMQTASGLAAAHAQGLVHRDIKPANILLENGVERVKITDFGLARAVDDVGMTQTGLVAGTPQYMAPEQANGESIDVRSDLFSLGSVLYTMCTGRPPFRATTTMGLLKRICEETPRPIRELNPEIPEWLEIIISKLLKKHPADRYQSAKDVAELLGSWLAHVQRPTSVPSPSRMTEVSEESGVDGAAENQPAAGRTKVSSNNPSNVDAIPGPNTSSSKESERPGQVLPKPASGFWNSIWGDCMSIQPFSGDVQKALETATAALTALGFQLTEKTFSSLRMKGPGPNQSRGNVLSLASEIEVRHHGTELSVHATMGTLRLVDGLLLMIYSLGSVIALSQAWPTRMLGLLVVMFFGLLIVGSIVSRRKIARRAIENFLSNLTGAGTSTPTASSEKVVLNEESVPQRFGEVSSSPIYWISMGIWGAFLVPLIDAGTALPFGALAWIALAIVILGVAIPFFAVLYAWQQKGRMGSWETTILKCHPRKWFSNPLIVVFLVSAGIWVWRAPTRGTVVFDIDDRNFTVTLSRNAGNHRYESLGSYSADYYPLRLSPGKYSWEVKQGSSALDRGEFDLAPQGKQVIQFRSPYPIGDADIAMMTGRWKFTWQSMGAVASMRSESPASSADYIDVSKNELRISSSEGMTRFRAAFGKYLNIQAADKNFPQVYSMEFPGPPSGQRGPKWIDLFVTDETTKARSLVAHGIFSADAIRMSMHLAPSTSPRPVNWIADPNQSISDLQIQFDRADDLTQLQGVWNVQMVEVNSKPSSQLGLHLKSKSIRFLVAGNVVTIWTLPDKNDPIEAKNQVCEIKLDPTHTPRRITLTHSPQAGMLVLQEGIYRLDGDQLIVVLAGEGRIPQDFKAMEGVERIELTRANP